MNHRLTPRLFSRLTIVGSSYFLLLSLSSIASADELSLAPGPRQPYATVPGDSRDEDGAVTLAELLSHAETHSPSLSTAEARIAVAKAGVTAQEPWFAQNPEISASIGSRSSSGSSGVQYEISVAQQLGIGGERSLRRRAAEAEHTSKEFERAVVAWKLHVAVHRLHNELLLLDERRKQAQRFVLFSESLRKIASKQLAAGETSPLTLLVAEAELAQARSALLEVEQQESIARITLTGLVGWPQETPVRVRGKLPERVRAPNTRTLLALMAKHHPSLRARKQAVAAAHAKLKAERRAGLPRPTVGGTYAKEPALAGQPDTDIWMFNLSLPLPLWQRNQGEIASKAAKLELAESEVVQTENALESSLIVAQTALDSAARRVELYEQGVIPQLQKHLDLLQKAYELGEVDLLQVSQTKERLLDGTKQYLDARVAYFGAVAELEGLIGTELTRAGEVSP